MVGASTVSSTTPRASGKPMVVASDLPPRATSPIRFHSLVENPRGPPCDSDTGRAAASFAAVALG